MSSENVEKNKQDFQFDQKNLSVEHGKLNRKHPNPAQSETGSQESAERRVEGGATLPDSNQNNERNSNCFDMLMNFAQNNCNQKFRDIENQLALKPDATFSAIQNELKHFLDTSIDYHAGKWKEHFCSWYTVQITEFLEDVGKMLSMVRMYNENMNTQIVVQFPCVDPQKLIKAHADNLNAVNQMNLKHTWKHEHLQKQAYRTIENAWKHFDDHNSQIIEQERELVDAAISAAVEFYKESMSAQTIEKGHNNDEIESIHRISSQAIAKTFCEVPKFSYSYLWRLGETREKLLGMLEQQLVNYIKCSQTKSQEKAAVENQSFATSSRAGLTQSPEIGVGIYLSPTEVRVGVYHDPKSALIYTRFPLYITIGGDKIHLSKLQNSSNSSSCFHIYNILLEGTSIRRTVHLSNQVDSLRSEEIIALYFSKIRTKAVAQSRKVSVRSCVVSITAFLPPSSKQMLKDSLKLAGFYPREIIQTTTAIGISYIQSYIHWSNAHKNHFVALVHSNSSKFEVAIAQVLGDSNKSLVIKRINNNENNDMGAISLLKAAWLTMKSIFGNDPSKEELKKSIIGMMSTLTLKEEDLGAYVFVDPERQEKTVLRVDKKGNRKTPIQDSPNTAVNENEGVVLGTALLDAMSLGIYSLDKPIVYKEASVDEYLLGNTAGQPNCMTRDDFLRALQNVTSILKLGEQEPMETDATGSTASSFAVTDSVVEKELVKAKAKLAQLVSLVKGRLESDTLKNAFIKSMIQNTVQDSEKALQNHATKVAQIQTLVKHLELASSEF